MTIKLTLFAVGVTLLSGSLIYLLLQKLSARIQFKRKSVFRNVKRTFSKRQPLHDWFPAIGAFAGILSALLLMWGGDISWHIVNFVMWVGIVLGLLAKAITKKENRYGILRDASTFFKAVEVRLKAGYNIPHTLRMAAALAPSMQPAVNKALQRWSFDPHQALETLRQELKMPEAETLCYVLKRAYEAGGESVAHVLGQGARNIDSKLMGMEEKSFAVGKMRMLFWRVLPTLTIFGIFALNFAYYAQTTLFQAIQNIK